MADMVSPYLMMGRKPANQDPFGDSLGLNIAMDPNAAVNQQQVMEQAPQIQPLAQEPVQPMQPMQQPSTQGYGYAGPTEEERQIIDRLRQQQQMALEAQAGGLKTAEQRLQEALAKPKEIDWSPLVALVDKWSGGNLMQAYQRPEDRNKQIQQLQEAVLKARGGLSDAAIRATEKELESINRQKENEYKRANLEYTREATAAAKQNRLQSKEQDRMDKLAKDIGKEKPYEFVSKSNAYVNALNTYMDLVEQYKLQPITSDSKKLLENALAEVSIKYKEAANLGALTGPDMGIIRQALPDATSLGEYVKNKAGFGTGAKGIINVLQQAKSSVKKDVDMAIGDLTTRYGKRGGLEYIDPLKTSFEKAYNSSSVAPPAFDKSALDAEMERRRKAKAAGGMQP
jgi:hypothetical protein